MSESELQNFVSSEWLPVHEEVMGWIKKRNKQQALVKIKELKSIFEKIDTTNRDDSVEDLGGYTLQDSFNTVVDFFFEIFDSDPWESTANESMIRKIAKLIDD